MIHATCTLGTHRTGSNDSCTLGTHRTGSNDSCTLGTHSRGSELSCGLCYGKVLPYSKCYKREQHTSYSISKTITSHHKARTTYSNLSRMKLIVITFLICLVSFSLINTSESRHLDRAVLQPFGRQQMADHILRDIINSLKLDNVDDDCHSWGCPGDGKWAVVIGMLLNKAAAFISS